MKARGYRIVHVVPATAELAATPTEPQQWRLRPLSENVATSHWPPIPNFVFAESPMLPGPWLSDSYWNDEWLTPSDRAMRRTGAVSLPRQAPWPRQMPLPRLGAVNALPVPAQSVFEFSGRIAAGGPGGRRATLAPRRTGGLGRACRNMRSTAPCSCRRKPAPPGGRAAENPAAQPRRPQPAGMRRSPAGSAEAFGPGQEKKRLTAQFVTILAMHSSTTMARKNRSI